MIPLKDQDLIRQKFSQELLAPVRIDFFTERELPIEVPGRKPCAYCKPARELLQDLARLSELIRLRVHIFDEATAEAKELGVERIPAIVVRQSPPASAHDRLFKFYGMPGGTEFPALIETLVDISRGEVLFSDDSLKALRRLKDEVRVKVFVTPVCPYCPGMMRAAYQLGLATPKVKAEVIEVNEFPELADRYRVQAVPLTVINERVRIAGAVPERALVEQLLAGAESSDGKPAGAASPSGPVTPAREEKPADAKRRESGLYLP